MNKIYAQIAKHSLWCTASVQELDHVLEVCTYVCVCVCVCVNVVFVWCDVTSMCVMCACEHQFTYQIVCNACNVYDVFVHVVVHVYSCACVCVF